MKTEKQLLKKEINRLYREYNFLSDRGFCTKDIKVKIMNLHSTIENL